MSAQSVWSRWARFVCKVVGLLLACAALVLCCAYLVVASWNPRGGSPTNIAVAPDGTVYISDSGRSATMFNIAGSCVWVIDSRADRVAGLIKIDRSYEGIGVAPNGKVYIFPTWLADHPPVDVEVLDPRTSRVSRIALPGCGFYAISFTPAGRALLTSDSGLQIVDTTTDQYVDTILSVPGRIIAFSETKFYAAGDGVGIVDSSTLIVRWVQDIPRGHCIDIAVAPDGQRAYASYYRGSYQAYQFGVLVIDTQTDTLIRDISLPTLVVGMAPLPDGRFYALCNGSDGAYYVTIMDSQTGTTLKTIPLDYEPHGYRNLGTPMRRRMVLAPNGKVYIVRGEDFAYGKPPGEERGIGVYVVDPSTDTVVNFMGWFTIG